MATSADAEVVIEELVTGRRKRTFSPEQLAAFARRDRRVFDLLIRYRGGEPVADAIVTELMPAVRDKAGRMNPQPPLYGRNDLRQELTTELLRLSHTLPLTRPDFLTRRLMLGAAKRLTRRLEREWYRQLDQVRLKELGQDPMADEQ
ncbi:MAG TPA: hypothetical protein VND96_13260 [Candidatus Micrarchaeaceae archaeon]|nr:hypothetical protein [Candidatus Micrarchaeaceae archaeon]